MRAAFSVKVKSRARYTIGAVSCPASVIGTTPDSPEKMGIQSSWYTTPQRVLVRHELDGRHRTRPRRDVDFRTSRPTLMLGKSPIWVLELAKAWRIKSLYQFGDSLLLHLLAFCAHIYPSESDRPTVPLHGSFLLSSRPLPSPL